MQRTGGGKPGPDDLDTAGVLDLDPGAGDGTSPRSSNGPDSGRRPRPECRGGAAAQGLRLPVPDVTLSDEVGQGERTRSRRSAWPGAVGHLSAGGCRSGCSGAGAARGLGPPWACWTWTAAMVQAWLVSAVAARSLHPMTEADRRPARARSRNTAAVGRDQSCGDRDEGDLPAGHAAGGDRPDRATGGDGPVGPAWARDRDGCGGGGRDGGPGQAFGRDPLFAGTPYRSLML